MLALDWIFAAILLISLALGAWRGLVYELLSLVCWVAAFVLAQWLAPDVAQKLPLAGAGDALRYAAGFALVFVLAIFVGGMLAALAKKLFAAVGLAPADRALGALFGLLRGVLLLLAITLVAGLTPLRESVWWQASVAARVCAAALKGLAPMLPPSVAGYVAV